ncbi:MAG: tripartite tricarboxylate transporter substrate binding protein, partial [Betaproteobacteria bacterium]|nr:tripartite tricarboxylate transporter substrate binding protein [Betaproteobacteria bacterium]
MVFIRTVVAFCLAAASLAASAQAFPTKPVTMIVPFPPGGSVDAVARQVAASLGQYLGQNVLVENKVGAGGTIGSGIAANAAPDGYTILLGTTSALGVSPALYKSVPYDSLKSFVPIIEVTRGPFVLSVKNDLPVSDLKGLIELAKKNPGKLNSGSAGQGSVHHLALEIFKQAAGLDIVHVPFKGGGPAWTALVGGQVDMLFDSMPGPLMFQGRAKPIAVAGPQRLPGLPGVPTFAEQGFPAVQTVFFWAMLAPAGTPPDVVAKLNSALGQTLRDPVVKGEFAKQSMETSPGTSEEI